MTAKQASTLAHSHDQGGVLTEFLSIMSQIERAATDGFFETSVPRPDNYHEVLSRLRSDGFVVTVLEDHQKLFISWRGL